MPEETPQLPISEQEVQIQVPSFFDKLKLQKKKILIGVGVFFGILIFAGAIFGVYKLGQKLNIPIFQRCQRCQSSGDISCKGNTSCVLPEGSSYGVCVPVPKMGQDYTISQINQMCGTNFSTTWLVPIPTPLATIPVSDPTADWETYTNTKLNFLIKYPNEWAINDSDTGPIEKQINIIRFYQSRGQTNKALDVLMITMYIQDNIRNVSLTDLEKNLEEVKTFGDDNILGIKGYDKQYLKENHKVYVADIIKNNLIYTLTTGPRVISDDDIETFNLILSTFKFLPSTGHSTLRDEPSGSDSKSSSQGKKVYCEEPRPEVCTMECLVNPPYICGSDGKSYCTECQACANLEVEWYVTQDEPCGSL